MIAHMQQALARRRRRRRALGACDGYNSISNLVTARACLFAWGGCRNLAGFCACAHPEITSNTYKKKQQTHTKETNEKNEKKLERYGKTFTLSGLISFKLNPALMVSVVIDIHPPNQVRQLQRAHGVSHKKNLLNGPSPFILVKRCRGICEVATIFLLYLVGNKMGVFRLQTAPVPLHSFAQCLPLQPSNLVDQMLDIVQFLVCSMYYYIVKC